MSSTPEEFMDLNDLSKVIDILGTEKKIQPGEFQVVNTQRKVFMLVKI